MSKVFGIGIDIVSISRIKPWVNDTMTLERVFTERERAHSLNKRYPYKQLASFFAAKEALMKAIGTGWAKGVDWKDIEVLCNKGIPSINLHNKAKKFCHGKRVLLSLSCSDNSAIAMVVVLT